LQFELIFRSSAWAGRTVSLDEREGEERSCQMEERKVFVLELLSGNAALESTKSLKYFFISKEKYK
jgi:hypothetical protein